MADERTCVFSVIFFICNGHKAHCRFNEFIFNSLLNTDQSVETAVGQMRSRDKIKAPLPDFLFAVSLRHNSPPKAAEGQIQSN